MKTINGYDIIATQEEVSYALSVLGEEFTKEELESSIESYKTLQVQKQLEVEALSYLASTEWVNTYKLRHDLGLDIIHEDSSKWEVINKRAEYIEFLKGAK